MILFIGLDDLELQAGSVGRSVGRPVGRPVGRSVSQSVTAGSVHD